MRITSILGLAAVSVILTACQSNSFKIKGEAKFLHDNDTLFLTTDLMSGTPRDTILIKDGAFELEGTTDSTRLCMIYDAKDPTINVPFFLEPGKIRVLLNEKTGASRVSGSKVNNEWQTLSDTVMAIGWKITAIFQQMNDENLSLEKRQQLARKTDEYNQQITDQIVSSAEKNIDNELGFFIVTNYVDESVVGLDRKLELIQKMPDEMRKRPAIKEFEQLAKQMAATEPGNMLRNFKMNAPDGKTIDILEEVGKHQVTILDFWASWCGPCRREMPEMVEMYTQWKDKGLGIIGVSLDNNQEDWTNAISQMGLKWTHVSDLKGWNNEAAQLFSVRSIPFTLVVDNQGKILFKGLRGEELRKAVEEKLR